MPDKHEVGGSSPLGPTSTEPVQANIGEATRSRSKHTTVKEETEKDQTNRSQVTVKEETENH